MNMCMNMCMARHAIALIEAHSDVPCDAGWLAHGMCHGHQRGSRHEPAAAHATAQGKHPWAP